VPATTYYLSRLPIPVLTTYTFPYTNTSYLTFALLPLPFDLASARPDDARIAGPMPAGSPTVMAMRGS